MGVKAGRWAARADEGTVVFLIGMRINRLSAVKQWWPVFTAMPRMLRELSRDPELGLLGARGLYDPPRGATMIQYWRSAADLQAFAGDRDRTHRPAWTAFFRAAYQSEAVGVWHETYVLGGHESVYVNMPAFGLGAAVPLSDAATIGHRAADRMSASGRHTQTAGA